MTTTVPSIPLRQAQVAQLCEYFESVPDGAVRAWEQIARETTIAMDGAGRDLVRRALRRARRPYAAVRGVGVELSSADNAMTIMRGRFVRIDRAVTQADRTRASLAERHIERMSGEDRSRMLMLASFFGAVRTIARDARPRIIAAREAAGLPEKT